MSAIKRFLTNKQFMVCIIIIGSEYKTLHKENATLSVFEYQILREMGINGRSENLLKLVTGKLERMGEGGLNIEYMDIARNNLGLNCDSFCHTA